MWPSCQFRFFLAGCLLLFCSGLARVSQAEETEKKNLAEIATKEISTERKIDFTKQIQPIFRKACYSCHGADEAESGFRLDVRSGALEGGDSGKAIIPGKSGKSPLLALVSGTDPDGLRMPPEGEGSPLDSRQIELLRAWIDQGAQWPESEESPDGSRKHSDHWSFQPIAKSHPPVVKTTSWSFNAIDHFILARLEKQDILPSPEADRVTLLRRLSFDLLGLPPSLVEIETFVNDPRADAYERLVDRLLSSPHYGERWGRHWLDLARYADSDGYEKDRPRPHAWRYRDWVIDAFSKDLPFDQFTQEQLAGDLLPGAALQQRIATGFHRNTLHNTEGGTDKEEDRVKKTVDRTNTTATVWLGITLGCSQCHSHKYDPFSQREYYQMYAFFNNINESDMEITPKKSAAATVTLVASADKKKPAKNTAKAQTVSEGSRQAYIHIRGDFLQKGDDVGPQTLEVLPAMVSRGPNPDRLDMARWIVSPENPLTARVIVNRLWQRYFGQGIVVSEDDFGTQGELPSHPQLLDYLANELIRRQWSLKAIHRLIVTSATYRQSSVARPELQQIDPENIYLARQNRRRVEAEIVRDAALSVSGLLDTKVGGPSVRPPQPSGISNLTYANSAKWTVSQAGDRYRRGMYTFFQRTSPYPMFMTFDSPDSNISCTRRSYSNTPLQALTLWNDPVFFECAQALARRIASVSSSGSEKEQIRRRAVYAFRLCLGRQPNPIELATLIGFYQSQVNTVAADKTAKDLLGDSPLPQNVSPAELAGWVMISRTLMNLDEFITKE